MAYVGCIAGAIPIVEYRDGLKAAGFDAIDVIDSGADLNAYAKVEGQSGCCSPAMAEAPPARKSAGLKIVPSGSSCCSPAPAATAPVHAGLSDVLSRYDVNEFAVSVKVYALKP
jgi:hypothetical protein